MLKNGRLEIKIADVEGTGISHPKIGIMFDEEKNSISFSGSNNETGNGWTNNIEEFKDDQIRKKNRLIRKTENLKYDTQRKINSSLRNLWNNLGKVGLNFLNIIPTLGKTFHDFFAKILTELFNGIYNQQINPKNAKSLIIGCVIIATAGMFVDLSIAHPFIMIFFLILTSVTFSLFGFIIGFWADNFEKLQLIPILIITPLVFLGGSFYSINMLPPIWQNISLFNPVLYLVSGFRWSFYEIADVSIYTSLFTILLMLISCIIFISFSFAKGYKIKN